LTNSHQRHVAGRQAATVNIKMFKLISPICSRDYYRCFTGWFSAAN